jgi:DNA invertase Pin-like site-specific DNA recombinase
MTDLNTTIPQNKTVAVYARVSTTRVSTKGGQDTENQLAQLRTFCESQGWAVYHEYVDHASGKNADGRAEFQRLFADAAQRKFDLVLFWALDRFSREGVLATLQYLQRLSGYGVGYRSFTEGYLDSCGMFRDAVIGILAVIAKQERVRISERVTAGLARAKAAGRTGGRPKAIFNRAKAHELRQAGLSIAKIAAQMGVSGPTIFYALKKPVAIAPAATWTQTQQDAISALQNLGAKRVDAETAVRGARGETFDDLLRDALRVRSVA